jgi:hypothetical protein
MGYSGAWGKLIDEKKKLEVENLVALSPDSKLGPMLGHLEVCSFCMFFYRFTIKSVPRRLFFATQQRIAITWKPK